MKQTSFELLSDVLYKSPSELEFRANSNSSIPDLLLEQKLSITKMKDNSFLSYPIFESISHNYYKKELTGGTNY